MNLLDLIQAASQTGLGGVNGVQPRFGGGSDGNVPNVLSLSGDSGPDIPVTAPKQRTIDEDTRSAPNEYTNREIASRKGLFGVKGTLRDVLGAVGDAFLIGSGRQAIYRPVREQEKLGDAIYKYDEDPVAAINRAALVNPEAAMDLQKQYDQGRRIDSQMAAAKLALQQKAGQVLGGWLGAIQKSSNPGQQYSLARDKLRAYAQANGVSDLYDLPDAYDADAVSAMFGGSISPDDQVDNDRASAKDRSEADYRKGQLSVAQQRAAEQGRHNRAEEARPRSSSVDHGPGATNVDAQVLTAIANGTATPNQKAYYDSRLAHPEKKGSILDRLRAGNPSIPPPPGGTVRKIK